MDTDEIVKLSELRSYLECLTECSYQAQNHRRIKDPRIWSLHDLVALETNTSPAYAKATAGKPLTPLQNLEKGEIIKAPLDGLFYLKASPNEPAFVQVGSILNPGDTLGLIEIMKCFHPLRYEGKSSKTVTQILIQDNTPVKTGDPILVLTL